MAEQTAAGERRIAPWSAREAMLGVGLVAGGAILLAAGLALATRGSDTPLDGPIVTAVIAAPHMLMVLAAWYLSIRKYRAPWSALGLRRPRHRLSMLLPWPTLLASIGFGGAYFAVVTALGLDSLTPSGIPGDILGEGAQRLVNVLMIGLAGPLVEELFFRGFLLAALAGPLGAFRAAAAASVLFAAGHVEIGVMVPFFVSGMLLSWLYLRTRSVWPPFLAHAAQNLLALSLAAAA